MIVSKDNNKINIKFRYDFQLVNFVRELDGRTYSSATKSWALPLTTSPETIRRLEARGFSIEPEVWEHVLAVHREAQEAVAIAKLDDTEFETTLPLFPYQKVGASFLKKIGSGLIGDEPGVGKTLQVLAVVKDAPKVLVFCPAVLKYQWASEIEDKFLPGSKVVVVDGSVDNRLKLWTTEAQFYIANYELLLRDFQFMDCREWDYILADECTKIQNHTAKQSKAIKKLRAKHRIAMSGTPVSNSPENIWNILDWAVPGSLGSYWNFLARYCIKNQWGGIVAHQNMEELRDKIKRFMIRRLKRDVLPELPDRIESDLTFVLSEEESQLQKKLKQELLFDIAQTDISKLENPMTIQATIVKFMRLRQLADSLELLGENKKSSKLEVLKEKLEEFKDTDQKILIFSEFSEMCKILERELVEYNPAMIIGDVPNKDRQPILDRFNTDPACKVCILSSAGQYGLNITSAEIVINYDLPFSLAKLEQRIGRAHRIGQKRNVMIYNLLGKGTADMAIKRIIHSKQKISDEILGDNQITMSDLQEILTYDDAKIL